MTIINSSEVNVTINTATSSLSFTLTPGELFVNIIGIDFLPNMDLVMPAGQIMRLVGLMP